MLRPNVLVAIFMFASSYSPAFGGSVDYKKAFARPGMVDTTSGEAEVIDTPPAAGDDGMSALREMGSFPVRVHTGNDDSQGGWPNSPLRDYAPKPLERRFKVAGCDFAIRTGDFTLRRYERGGSRLNVAHDSVERLTTLVSSSDEPVMVSVNADLYVSVAPAAKQACKQLFGGRRLKIGSVDLGSTELRAQDQAGDDALLQTVAKPHPTEVYLSWDVHRDTLVMEDAAGLAPAVESAIFSVAAKTAGDYYLAVTPHLGLTRKSADAAAR